MADDDEDEEEDMFAAALVVEVVGCEWLLLVGSGGAPK